MSLIHTGGNALIEGRMTGKVESASVSWEDGLRFVERVDRSDPGHPVTTRVLQQRWNCYENDYDNESSRTWKEWRDVPMVTEDDDADSSA